MSRDAALPPTRSSVLVLASVIRLLPLAQLLERFSWLEEAGRSEEVGAVSTEAEVMPVNK